MAGEWDTGLPVDHTLISDIPGEERKITSKTKTVLQKEHRALGDGNSGGEHTQGSAISYFLATASAPTLNPDGTAFATADLGRLWFDITTSELKVLVAITPTWKIIPSTAAAIALLSTLDVAGAFSVATNKFNVAAASGNVTAAGTLEATGLTTVADRSLTKTDAAPTAGTAEIANAKYVDDEITEAITGIAIGGYEKTDADTAALAKDVTYQAPVAGFFIAAGGRNESTTVKVNSSTFSSLSNGEITDFSASNYGYDNNAAQASSVMLIVPKDWFVRCNGPGTPRVFWVPFGTGSLTK